MPLTDPDQAPLGATVRSGGVDFRVWSPDAARLDVEIAGMLASMTRDDGDVWTACVEGIGPGTRYRYRIDDRWSYPDPYTRSQPDGPHGESEVVDPASFAWNDAAWGGLTAQGLVIYEMHVGTFTREGTFDAAIAALDGLADLGVTAIELMPIAEFPGERNWGYDGVDLFAPTCNYGGPLAMLRFIDAAHARGIGVILDVVYNHFGPDAAHLLQYAQDYLTSRYTTAWGDAINFDGPNSPMVRRFVLDNVRHWVRDFHVDGLRLDAVFTIHDASPRHILEEITATGRASGQGRGIVMMAETYENDEKYIRPASDGGLGFDAVWADDFHHVVHAHARRDHTGYYADYDGSLAELERTINRGWLYEGQTSQFLGIARGTSSERVPATGLVYCLQNHDQVANRSYGERLSAVVPAGDYRAWSALLLLLPYTPLIFMGQEFAASSPFYYFTDHHGELGEQITDGRFQEFALHESPEERSRRFPDPQALDAFVASKLDLNESERPPGAMVRDLYAALLRLRRDDEVLRRQNRTSMRAVAASDDLLWVHMWRGDQHRLVVLNLGGAARVNASDASIDAGFAGLPWETLLSTDETRFGGAGIGASLANGRLAVPPHGAVLFAARG